MNHLHRALAFEMIDVVLVLAFPDKKRPLCGNRQWQWAVFSKCSNCQSASDRAVNMLTRNTGPY